MTQRPTCLQYTHRNLKRLLAIRKMYYPYPIEMENSTDRFCRVRLISVYVTEPEGNLCRVPDLLQNSQKCKVLWYNSHRTHRSVGYCIQSCQGILCGVPDLLQNSQKCRVLWCNCHRTHRSIGYCGATVTELTEVVCGVTTDGNYPRYPRESLYLHTFSQSQRAP